MPRMSLPNVTPRVFCTISGLVVVGLLLSACAGSSLQKKAGGMVPAAELEAERQQRQALHVQQQLKDLRNQSATKGELEEQPALEEKLAKLSIILLEKRALIKNLGERLKEVILEVVRMKAKLRSLESKAEAASNLAETEIALKALMAKGNTWEDDPTFSKADQLTKLSALEFKKGNYGGTRYLTGQAKNLIKDARERSMSREMVPMLEGEVPFAMPLPLQLLKKGDAREGPGVQFNVLYSLNQGTPLIGHSYKGEWVRVEGGDGRGGWIFYKLLGGN